MSVPYVRMCIKFGTERELLVAIQTPIFKHPILPVNSHQDMAHGTLSHSPAQCTHALSHTAPAARLCVQGLCGEGSGGGQRLGHLVQACALALGHSGLATTLATHLRLSVISQLVGWLVRRLCWWEHLCFTLTSTQSVSVCTSACHRVCMANKELGTHRCPTPRPGWPRTARWPSEHPQPP